MDVSAHGVMEFWLREGLGAAHILCTVSQSARYITQGYMTQNLFCGM